MKTLIAIGVVFILGTTEVSANGNLWDILSSNWIKPLSDNQNKKLDIPSTRISPPATRIPLKDALRTLAESRVKAVEQKLKNILEEKLQLDVELIGQIGSGNSSRVLQLLELRRELVKDLDELRQQRIDAQKNAAEKKQGLADFISNSNKAVSIDLIIEALSCVYSEEMAEGGAAQVEEDLNQKLRLPFLRPIISIVTPEGLPVNATVETEIYVNSHSNNAPKQNDFLFVSKFSGFSGENLHVDVGFQTLNCSENISEYNLTAEDKLEREWILQKVVIENQIKLTHVQLKKQVDNLNNLVKRSKKILHELKASKESRDLGDKLDKKRIELRLANAERQAKLIEKELKKQNDFLEELDENETKFIHKDDKAARKIIKEHMKLLSKLEKKHRKHHKKGSKKEKVESEESVEEVTSEQIDVELESDSTEVVEGSENVLSQEDSTTIVNQDDVAQNVTSGEVEDIVSDSGDVTETDQNVQNSTSATVSASLELTTNVAESGEDENVELGTEEQNNIVLEDEVSNLQIATESLSIQEDSGESSLIKGKLNVRILKPSDN